MGSLVTTLLCRSFPGGFSLVLFCILIAQQQVTDTLPISAAKLSYYLHASAHKTVTLTRLTVKAVKNSLAENVTHAHKLAPKDSRFSLSDVPDQSGKVAVVTGGSEGIGYGCTHTLLSRNISKLFIISQAFDVVVDALNTIRDELGEPAAAKAVWVQCDLSDWGKTAGRGIMKVAKNVNGVDLHMAANHLGHVVLTSHLLPLMKKTADLGNTVRIVTLDSNTHQAAPKETRFESLEELNTDFGPEAQYGRSKLAQMLYARYHADRLRTSAWTQIRVQGFVETAQIQEHIHDAWPVFGHAVSAMPRKKNAMEGAVSAMYAATVTEESGQFICPPVIVESGNELSQDKNLWESLMKLTEEVIQQKTHASDKGCPLEEY